MNKCENYTLDCEAKDCSECDNFWWDGTGKEPKDNTIDTTKEFMKGAILGYCQTRTPEEVGELFDCAFEHLKRKNAADICLALTASFFKHYDYQSEEVKK